MTRDKNIRKFGLIGYPLSHSFSPKYFKDKFEKEDIQNANYQLYPLEQINDFLSLKTEGLEGLNVTIPYKELIIPFLDEIEEEAKKIMAINTIKFKNGVLTGYNTDVYGFEKSLKDFLGEKIIKNALILGTGGASKAVEFVLKKMNIQCQKISRGPDFKKYEELTENDITAAELIVNTSPLGMYPLLNKCPDIPYKAIGSKHYLFDLIYNPEKSLFLKRGESNGASTKNGRDMLIFQAEKSWEIWNNE